MTEHVLKCLPQFMSRIADGQKTFETRKNDRDFQVGDTLFFQQYNPARDAQWSFSDRHPPIKAKITYMSSDFQQDGYVVLGIKVIPENTVRSDRTQLIGDMPVPPDTKLSGTISDDRSLAQIIMDSDEQELA